MLDSNSIIPLSEGTILKGREYVYRIERMVGHGAFGVTYMASTRMKMQGPLGLMDANVKVTIKEFYCSRINGREGSMVTCSNKKTFTDYKRMFLREARNLEKLSHPHIVKVLEVFEANNTYYYSMEYLDGGSLDHYLQEKNGLPESEALGLIAQLGDALQFMHEHRMLHLDLKPKNIMRREKNGNLLLIDFGLSKQFNEEGEPESETSIGLGTQGYAPIEQANYQRGDGFPVTLDVYALGATLYKMLVGHAPNKASDILNNGFPEGKLRQRKISNKTIAAIRHAMELRKIDRTPSIKAFMEELGIKSEEEDTIVKPIPEPSPKSAPSPLPDPKQVPVLSPTSSWKKWATALVVGVVAALAVIFWPKEKENGGDPVIPQPSDTAATSTGKGSINGHNYVDLGLSVKWADRNVGASSPSDYGSYFAWGETRTKSEYTESNSVTYEKSFSDISGNSRYDAARANWGGSWRLPTKSECEELDAKCTWTWTTQGGHKGYKVTGPNGNSIFLPAAGYRLGTSLSGAGERGDYWSSAPDESDTQSARGLSFGSSNHSVYWGTRNFGISVRPVSDELLSDSEK